MVAEHAAELVCVHIRNAHHAVPVLPGIRVLVELRGNDLGGLMLRVRAVPARLLAILAAQLFDGGIEAVLGDPLDAGKAVQHLMLSCSRASQLVSSQ